MAKKLVPVSSTPHVQELMSDPKNKDIVALPVKVVAKTDGPVTLFQKLSGYYKAAIALVGSLIALATQVQFLTPFLPEQYRGYVGLGIAILTGVATFLKENAHWFEDSQTA